MGVFAEREIALDVEITLDGGEARLRLCGLVAEENVGEDRDARDVGEALREEEALVVASVSESGPMEWDGNYGVESVCNASRRGASSHLSSEVASRQLVAAVFKSMDELAERFSLMEIEAAESRDERHTSVHPLLDGVLRPRLEACRRQRGYARLTDANFGTRESRSATCAYGSGVADLSKPYGEA